jgi:integrase
VSEVHAVSAFVGLGPIHSIVGQILRLAERSCVAKASMGACLQRCESEPKTRMGKRSLALDPATLAALQEHKAQQEQERADVGPAWMDSGLVFTRPDGAPIHPDLITDWFRRLARNAGLPPIRLHDVRHSYATAALAAGVPAKVVSERLGHANIAITLDVYSHVIPGMDEAAANAVASLILDGFGPSERPGPKPGPSTDK